MARITVLLTFILLTGLFVAPSGSGEGLTRSDGSASDALNVALGLFRTAHHDQREDSRRAALDHLRDELFPHSLVTTGPVEAAWSTQLHRPAEEGAAPLAAESLLLAFVRDNVLAALESNDAESLDLWMRLAHSRSDRGGWSIPEWASHRAEAPHQQNITKDLDSLLASRARETLFTAMLLERAGMHDAAAATADGASALMGLLVDTAAERLPEDLARPFNENATRGRALLSDLPDERNADTWPGLIAPLVAIELDRDIEPLDVYAMRNIDAAYGVLRAAEETPALRAVLAEHAWLQYGADRAGLFLRGEGVMNETDDAYAHFRDAAAIGDLETLSAAVTSVRVALTQVGLLERGIVFKVETGGVQQGRTHEYRLTLVRPPLEGVARYTLRLIYDPTVLAVTGAEPFGPHEHPEGGDGSHSHGDVPGWDVRFDNGVVRLDVTPDVPVRRSAHIITLFLEARGAQGSQTPITIEEAVFFEPDGDLAEVFRLRDGHATVTVTPDNAGNPPLAAQSPVVPVGIVLAAMAIAAGRRRDPCIH
ncbi:MAG: hypothetical protein KY455_00355 [Euryarchaeota archaeon]|nr:hypothetical protein [Euryarchaeota archaeon]